MNKPVIFEGKSFELEEVRSKFNVLKIIDTYEEQLDDLFLIRNPKYRFDKNYKDEFKNFVTSHTSDVGSLNKCGSWVFFPWNGYLVHYLSDTEHQEVRTARNRNLLTAEEQRKFYNFSVGVAGLSVGSHGALTLAVMGGSRLIKLADPDTVSPSNLNRMRFDFTQIGTNKAELVAQYIYQLNPYADVRLYTEGITDENIDDFLENLDILIEELDDIEMKVRMREESKKRRIPVVMATDNGDNVIIDVERFDLHPEMQIFNGALEGFDVKEVKKSPQKLFEAMARIIDLSLVPTRVLNSVLEVGKTIYSWPQLASAATLSGVVIAYLVRKIALKEKVREGKYEVNIDAVLDGDYALNEQIRVKELEKFKEKIGL